MPRAVKFDKYTEPAGVAVPTPQAQGSTSDNVPKILADDPVNEPRVTTRRHAERSHKGQAGYQVRTARAHQQPYAAPWSFW
jgi:hypothetical protein